MTTNQQENIQNSEEDVVDLAQVVGFLLENKRFIILFAATVAIFTYLYVWASAPTYQANALVATKALRADTEVEIIKSRDVVGRVVDELDLTIIVEPKHFPLFGAAIARGNSLNASTSVPAYFGLSDYAWGGEQIQVTHFIVPKAQENNTFIIKSLGSAGYQLLDADNNLILSSAVNKLAKTQQIKIFVAKLNAREGVVFNLTKQDRNSAIRSLQDGLQVTEQGKRTRIVQISISSKKGPAVAQSATNATVVAYIERDIEQRVMDIENNLSFLSSRLSATEMKLKASQAKLDSYEKSVNVVKEELVLLNREVKSRSIKYDRLLSQIQEVNIIHKGIGSDIRVIDRAVLPTESVDNKRLIVVISFFVGVLLAIVLALLKKAIAQKITSPVIIESKTGFPIFASIPFSPEQSLLEQDIKTSKTKHLVLADYSNKCLTIEALKSLRTSLSILITEAQGNVVMLTSPSPNIGKSFVVSNLATIYTAINKKVLLIDADMRRGHIHKNFGISKSPGLSEFLAGDALLDEVIESTGNANFDIIVRGTLPDNPSELLGRDSLSQLLERCSEKYDLVIVDTPPALAVTDPSIIGRFCNINFVLLYYDTHKLSEIEATIARLERNKVVVNGFIFNGMDLSNRSYGYGASSYYQYEYGKSSG